MVFHMKQVKAKHDDQCDRQQVFCLHILEDLDDENNRHLAHHDYTPLPEWCNALLLKSFPHETIHCRSLKLLCNKFCSVAPFKLAPSRRVELADGHRGVIMNSWQKIMEYKAAKERDAKNVEKRENRCNDDECIVLVVKARDRHVGDEVTLVSKRLAREYGKYSFHNCWVEEEEHDHEGDLESLCHLHIVICRVSIVDSFDLVVSLE